MHSYIVLLFNKARALPIRISESPIRSERQAIRRQRPTTSSVLTNAHSMPETSKAKKTHIQLGTYRKKRRKQHDAQRIFTQERNTFQQLRGGVKR